MLRMLAGVSNVARRGTSPTIYRIAVEEMLHFLRGLPRGTVPIMDEPLKHAERTKALLFSEFAENRQVSIRHAHVLEQIRYEFQQSLRNIETYNLIRLFSLTFIDWA